MTDISPTKTIAVLGVRPTERTAALRILAAGLAAAGLRPVPVPDDPVLADPGPGAATAGRSPTVAQLRRADWVTAFDTVLGACDRERHARTRVATGVLLVSGAALRALARYRVGLTLRREDCDASIRGWLEGPAAGAAAGYAAVLHVRPAAPAGYGERLYDRALREVLDRLAVPPQRIFTTPFGSDVRHTVSAVVGLATRQGVPTSIECDHPSARSSSLVSAVQAGGIGVRHWSDRPVTP
ncbi:hypothetical protein [Kutzneria sp. CA-103260]|uniref:hypothetical protein n=1 Tax=Kutzneria sp. CA-103260 TaxID=2802641 RepID=UPI001BAC4BBE|nr:hypothetical protein [Kutzneria sp. CA-103260]QUQ70620.1 hypothetical protein JJ691_84030 [Kutzneria sp. CA-103260]